MYEVGILLQCVFYIVGQITVPATCTCTYVLYHRLLCQLQGTVPAAYVLYQLQLYQLPILYQLRQSRCQLRQSFDQLRQSFDQRMSATVQRMSAGVQRMSATVQRMSANFQNKAVSKYFWNMYQLMSAAVHVLRYVLSSGYQMRALHEFTNVSGS